MNGPFGQRNPVSRRPAVRSGDGKTTKITQLQELDSKFLGTDFSMTDGVRDELSKLIIQKTGYFRERYMKESATYRAQNPEFGVWCVKVLSAMAIEEMTQILDEYDIDWKPLVKEKIPGFEENISYFRVMILLPHKWKMDKDKTFTQRFEIKSEDFNRPITSELLVSDYPKEEEDFWYHHVIGIEKADYPDKSYIVIRADRRPSRDDLTIVVGLRYT